MELKAKPIIRPARKDDVIALQGSNYDLSFRGIVVEMDGKILGIAGVMHTSPLHAFSTIMVEMGKYPKTIVYAMREFRDILKKYGDSPIYALVDQNKETALGFLNHVGFEHYRDGVYKWPIQ